MDDKLRQEHNNNNMDFDASETKLLPDTGMHVSEQYRPEQYASLLPDVYVDLCLCKSKNPL